MAHQLRRVGQKLNDISLGNAEQAQSLLQNYILMELVLDVARCAEDPQRKLAELFDRVTLRARLGGHAVDMTPFMARFQKLAQEFFLLAGKRA